MTGVFPQVNTDLQGTSVGTSGDPQRRAALKWWTSRVLGLDA
jgi:hypothetical protein